MTTGRKKGWKEEATHRKKQEKTTQEDTHADHFRCTYTSRTRENHVFLRQKQAPCVSSRLYLGRVQQAARRTMTMMVVLFLGQHIPSVVTACRCGSGGLSAARRRRPRGMEGQTHTRKDAAAGEGQEHQQ